MDDCEIVEVTASFESYFNELIGLELTNEIATCRSGAATPVGGYSQNDT